MDLHDQVVNIVEKIVADVQALATQLEGPGPRADSRELERQCRDLGLAVGHELFVRLLQGYGDGKQGTTVRCPCGSIRRWVGTRPRTLRDLMNREVTLARAYYFCATCGQGWLPLDEALGLTSAQVTPALYEVAVTCGSVAPPEEAAELLTLVAGIELSAKSIERYTKTVGAVTDRALDQRAQASEVDTTPEPQGEPASPERPYNIQLDGGMLRMCDRTFREVKVACLFDGRDLAELHAGRRELLRKHYEAHLGGPDRLGQLTYAAARAYGVTADGANALSQGDGAPWVWNLVQTHWPAAVEVLDFYHLSEHLHACAQALWGVGSERARAWAREVGQQTLAADACAVYAALRQLRPTTAEGQQAVAHLRRYVQTHEHRMRYGECQRSPYSEPPGSGKRSHPGSPIVSQSGSPIWSHPGSAIWSHPGRAGRVPCHDRQPVRVLFGNPSLPGGDDHGWMEVRGDRCERAPSAAPDGRAESACRPGAWPQSQHRGPLPALGRPTGGAGGPVA